MILAEVPRPPCPECGGVTVVTKSRMLASGRSRRMECKTCNHAFNVSESGNTRPRLRRFDAADIRTIRESLDGRRLLAKQYNCSAEMIIAIRAGRLYRDLLPEGLRNPPGPGDPSCEQCREWLGPDVKQPCRFGFPEPVSEGLRFARDCAVFHQVEG